MLYARGTEIEAKIRCGKAARFALLKQQLILEQLDVVPAVEAHARVIQQAGEAAALAWLSGYPLLTFPCLFEEMAQEAVAQLGRQARRYWSGFALPPSALPRREHYEASPTRYLMRLRQDRVARRASARTAVRSALAAA